MKYTIHRMDGRHTHNDLFQYYIGFSQHMHINFGPAYFNRCLHWFIDTYGYSAEVGHYKDINRYFTHMNQLGIPLSKNIGESDKNQLCNPLWSWSLGYNDLRIYLAREQELAYFQLVHPIDQ